MTHQNPSHPSPILLPDPPARCRPVAGQAWLPGKGCMRVRSPVHAKASSGRAQSAVPWRQQAAVTGSAVGRAHVEELHCGGLILQVSAFRRRLEKVVGDKHEEIMARMGAIMATGAGGRPHASLHAHLTQEACCSWS